MTVGEFCGLCISDDEMEICSVNTGGRKTVFSGTFGEAMNCRYSEDEVWCFEIKNGKVVINI